MTDHALTKLEEDLLCNNIRIEDLLRGIPFAADSIAQLLERGSFNRELAERTARSIRRDVNWCLIKLERAKT